MSASESQAEAFARRTARATETGRPLIATVLRWNDFVYHAPVVFYPDGSVTPHLHMVHAREAAEHWIACQQVAPTGWFEGDDAELALQRAHLYGIAWQREGEEVIGPAYLLEAIATIRRLYQVRGLLLTANASAS